MFRVDIKLDISDAVTILDNHGLSKGGRVQQYFTGEVIRVTDAYVPLRSGKLKDTATQNNAPPYEVITYDTPYAHRLHDNPQYNFNGAPTRGAFWEVRAWADHGGEVVDNLQKFVDKE